MRQHYWLWILLGFVIAVSGAWSYVGRVNSSHPAVWANPGGDEGRRNFAKDRLPTNPKLLWSYDLLAGTTLTNSRNITLTPPVVWKDGTSYIGLVSKVHAVGPDGKKKWAWESKTPISNLALGRQGTVYAQADGMLYALNPDGTMEWQVEIPVLNADTRGLLVGQGGVIYVAGREYLVAVSSVGERKWRFKGGNISAGPVEMDDGKIVVMAGTMLYLLTRDGDIVWEKEAAMPSSALGLMAYQDKIYINGTATTLVLNKEGSVVTRAPASARVNPLIAIGQDFVQDGPTRFDAIWHASKWREDLPGLLASSSIVDSDGNALFFATYQVPRGGEAPTAIHMLNASGERVWEFDQALPVTYFAAAGQRRVWFAGYLPNSPIFYLICIGDE